MKFPRQTKAYDGPSTYLKIEDGQALVVILRGDLHAFTKTWPDGKTTQRYSVNAITSDGGQLLVKIWEFGPLVFGKLEEINEVYPLETIKIRVKRTGTKLDTEYNIMPLLKPEDQLTAPMLKAIEALELNILNKDSQPKAQSNADEDNDNWNGL